MTSKAIRGKAIEVLTELKNCPNGMPRLARGQKIDGMDVYGVSCMRGIEEMLCFSEKDRGKVWKGYKKKIMTEKMIEIIMWKEMQ